MITQPDDGQHVEPGEILVAPVTNPAWTPYFLTAAGVVMDMGASSRTARSSPASTASPRSSTSAPPLASFRPASYSAWTATAASSQSWMRCDRLCIVSSRTARTNPPNDPSHYSAMQCVSWLLASQSVRPWTSVQIASRVFVPQKVMPLKRPAQIVANLAPWSSRHRTSYSNEPWLITSRGVRISISGYPYLIFTEL